MAENDEDIFRFLTAFTQLLFLDRAEMGHVLVAKKVCLMERAAIRNEYVFSSMATTAYRIIWFTMT